MGSRKIFLLNLALNNNLDLLSQESWLLRANTGGWCLRNHLVEYSILRLFSFKDRIIKWVLLPPGNLLITGHLEWEQIVTLFGSWRCGNIHNRSNIDLLLNNLVIERARISFLSTFPLLLWALDQWSDGTCVRVISVFQRASALVRSTHL